MRSMHRNAAGRSLVQMVLACFVTGAMASPVSHAVTSAEIQRRIDADLARSRPIVVHVVVALCDNRSQGIVPVPAELGDGTVPRTNLYWGALYGVKTHLGRSGWTRREGSRPETAAILERVVLYREIERQGATVPVWIVADAWRGDRIRDALAAFFALAAGRGEERIPVGQGPEAVELRAGGAAHLVAWVGHNGLMDFELPAPVRLESREAGSSLVLACASKPYFEERLRASGSHPLLLTTGLMAPEAYTLDAAIRAWVGAADSDAVAAAAAAAYDRYQKCGARAARRLFHGSP